MILGWVTAALELKGISSHGAGVTTEEQVICPDLSARGNSVVECESHKLDAEGSTPSPATTKVVNRMPSNTPGIRRSECNPHLAVPPPTATNTHARPSGRTFGYQWNWRSTEGSAQRYGDCPKGTGFRVCRPIVTDLEWAVPTGSHEPKLARAGIESRRQFP